MSVQVTKQLPETHATPDGVFRLVPLVSAASGSVTCPPVATVPMKT